MAFGLSASTIGLISAGVGAASNLMGPKQSGNATTTQQNQLDPRISNIVFGQNGNDGLLSQYQGMLNTPQSAALKGYGQAAGDYLTNYGSQDMGALHDKATGLLNGSGTALASIPAYAVGNQIQAPNQNGIDLSGSYHSLLGGGDTTALNNSMNAAVNATNAGFKTNQDNVTNSLMRTVLPSIRSNSVLAGQYGGSRQGIAEGNAISDYTNQLTNANAQLGATNSANTTAQAAGAYQQGQDRALAATQGLGAQQYGVAAQNAGMNQAAEFMNVGNSYDASKTNASMTNNGALAGAGLLGGLGSTAYGAATNNQNYDINRATQVNGLLAPYLGANSSSTTSQPLYSNPAGNMLGGAMMGGQLAKGLGGVSNLFDGSAGDSIFNLLGLGSSL